MLPTDLGLALHALGVSAILLLLIVIEAYAPEGPKGYTPRKQRPPQGSVDQSFLHSFQQLYCGAG